MSIGPYLRLISCCNQTQTLDFQVPLDFGGFPGTYTYDGPNTSGLVDGQCYTVTQLTGPLSYVLSLPEIPEPGINLIDGDCSSEICDVCDPIAYDFVSCCGGNSIKFLRIPGPKNIFDDVTLPAVFKYIGDTAFPGEGGSLEPGACYTVYQISGSNVSYPFLPEAVVDNDIYGPTVNCNNPELCPICPPIVYRLLPCDPTGVPFCSETDLSENLGEFVNIDNIKTVGCYFVAQNATFGPCQDPVEVTVDPDAQCDCELKCYSVTGNPSSITYVNADLEVVTVIGNSKFCSYISPIVTGGAEGAIYELGLCIDGQCPTQCYELTNCQTSEVITVSNSESLTNYYLENKVVTLMGYEGCWTINTTNECDCAVDVVVLQVFSDCPSCLPIVAYKFINCKNSLQIKYSTEDFSAYVGKVVQLDCGDCWIVEQIDYTPPNIQTVTIDFTFDSCLACERTYYKLTDCQGIENPVYTYTDLLDQVGKVIKIENCDTCWEVEETRLIETVSVVKLISEYQVCLDCLLDKPCLCSTITNQYDSIKTFLYLDCLGNELPITLNPGETSDKVCLLNWMLDPEVESVYIQYFGDCVNNQCPVEALPKRKVKPGYSVPVCDTEKFEKITCKASEIYYKQVMRLRYGISNCCPEDEEKWLVKKELIDLQGLMDPNYTCTPVASCCQANDSCGCGCNTTLKTCNS